MPTNFTNAYLTEMLLHLNIKVPHAKVKTDNTL